MAVSGRKAGISCIGGDKIRELIIVHWDNLAWNRYTTGFPGKKSTDIAWLGRESKRNTENWMIEIIWNVKYPDW